MDTEHRSSPSGDGRIIRIDEQQVSSRGVRKDKQRELGRGAYLKIATELTPSYFYARRTQEGFSHRALRIEVSGRLKADTISHCWFSESPYGRLESLLNQGVLPEMADNDEVFATEFREQISSIREVFEKLKSVVKQKLVRDGFGYRLVVVDPVVDRRDFADAVQSMPRLVENMLRYAYRHLDAVEDHARVVQTRQLVIFLESLLRDYVEFQQESTAAAARPERRRTQDFRI